LIVFYSMFVNDRKTEVPQQTTTSTLFLIVDNQSISLELNQDDINKLNSNKAIAKNVQINGENVTITIEKTKNGQYTVTRGGTEIPSFQLTKKLSELEDGEVIISKDGNYAIKKIDGKIYFYDKNKDELYKFENNKFEQIILENVENDLLLKLFRFEFDISKRSAKQKSFANFLAQKILKELSVDKAQSFLKSLNKEGQKQQTQVLKEMKNMVLNEKNPSQQTFKKAILLIKFELFKTKSKDSVDITTFLPSKFKLAQFTLTIHGTTYKIQLTQKELDRIIRLPDITYASGILYTLYKGTVPEKLKKDKKFYVSLYAILDGKENNKKSLKNKIKKYLKTLGFNTDLIDKLIESDEGFRLFFLLFLLINLEYDTDVKRLNSILKMLNRLDRKYFSYILSISDVLYINKKYFNIENVLNDLKKCGNKKECYIKTLSKYKSELESKLAKEGVPKDVIDVITAIFFSSVTLKGKEEKGINKDVLLDAVSIVMKGNIMFFNILLLSKDIEIRIIAASYISKNPSIVANSLGSAQATMNYITDLLIMLLSVGNEEEDYAGVVVDTIERNKRKILELYIKESERNKKEMEKEKEREKNKKEEEKRMKENRNLSNSSDLAYIIYGLHSFLLSNAYKSSYFFRLALESGDIDPNKDPFRTYNRKSIVCSEAAGKSLGLLKFFDKYYDTNIPLNMYDVPVRNLGLSQVSNLAGLHNVKGNKLDEKGKENVQNYMGFSLFVFKRLYYLDNYEKKLDWFNNHMNSDNVSQFLSSIVGLDIYLKQMEEIDNKLSPEDKKLLGNSRKETKTLLDLFSISSDEPSDDDDKNKKHTYVIKVDIKTIAKRLNNPVFRAKLKNSISLLKGYIKNLEESLLGRLAIYSTNLKISNIFSHISAK